MIKILIRFFYNVIITLALPAVFIRLWWRGRRMPDYRKRWKERLGYFVVPPNIKGAIWVHAVSVGEVITAAPLIRQIKMHYSNIPIVVTTMTPTGSERVRALLGDLVFHVYFPYDKPSAVKRFLKRISPRVLILMETELWLNVLYYCHRKKIPVILANARLSKRSTRRYARFSRFTKMMLDDVSVVAAQDEHHAKRFRRLGILPDHLVVAGSIKFDVNLPASISESGELLRQQLGANRKIWIAASTHDGEEALVLQAFKEVLQELPDCLLVLVPRHPDRCSAVAKLCREQSLRLVFRSEKQSCIDRVDVFIVDTIGELMLFYSIAHVAFVGGSLIKHGGHNLLEPALLGLPIITGPHVFNFEKISQLLTRANALITVEEDKALARAVIQFLTDTMLSEQFGARAQAVVEANRGALKKHMNLIASFLSPKS